MQDKPSEAKTILFMHENAGNLCLRLHEFERMYRDHGVNIVAFAYRGYSDSEGYPTEQGLKLDS